MFAVVACAVAVPAAVPQPASQGAQVGIAPHGTLEKRQIDGLETGAATEHGQDLKGSSSYGYGYVQKSITEPINQAATLSSSLNFFFLGFHFTSFSLSIRFYGYPYGGYGYRPYWGGYGYPFYGGYGGYGGELNYFNLSFFYKFSTQNLFTMKLE